MSDVSLAASGEAAAAAEARHSRTEDAPDCASEPAGGKAGMGDDPAPAGAVDSAARIIALEAEVGRLRRKLAASLSLTNLRTIAGSGRLAGEVLARMQDLVLVTDLKGHIGWISGVCKPLLGYTEAELYDVPLSTVLAPETVATFEARVQTLINAQAHGTVTLWEMAVPAVFVPKAAARATTASSSSSSSSSAGESARLPLAPGRVHMDGLAQVWSAGALIEVVFTFRLATATDAIVAVRAATARPRLAQPSPTTSSSTSTASF